MKKDIFIFHHPPPKYGEQFLETPDIPQYSSSPKTGTKQETTTEFKNYLTAFLYI